MRDRIIVQLLQNKDESLARPKMSTLEVFLLTIIELNFRVRRERGRRVPQKKNVLKSLGTSLVASDIYTSTRVR